MTEYKMNGGRVLIVPGFTVQEQLDMKAEDENTESTIKDPNGVYLECQTVEYHPHIKNYEEFESAQGLILTEKACDTYAELSVTFVVHQNLTNTTGTITMDGKTTNLDINVSTLDPNPDTDIGEDRELMNAYVDPDHLTDEFIKLRYEFLKRFDGRPLTIISPLFPPMIAAYLTECEYAIEPGEDVALYTATFREVLSTGI